MSTKVIIGKQNSGKSLRAEELAVSYGGSLYYVATMKVMDEEGRKRVEKHRKQREGKGFITIECEYDIRRIVSHGDRFLDSSPGCQENYLPGCPGDLSANPNMSQGTCPRDSQATVLLECVANLVGNELFDNPDRPWSADPMKVDKEEFVRIIIDDIRYLADHVANLIIVSSEYELDERADDETKLYLSLLNIVNGELLSENIELSY